MKNGLYALLMGQFVRKANEKRCTWYLIRWNPGIISCGILVPYSTESPLWASFPWHLILWNTGILSRGTVVSFIVEYPLNEPGTGIEPALPCDSQILSIVCLLFPESF